MTGLGARVLVNVALLSLALALTVLIWLEPWRQPPPAPERLSAIDPAEITRLRIEARNRAPVELERKSSGWRLVAPLSLPASEYRVSALLALATAPVHDAFRAEGNDLGEFGLAPPKARVMLNEQEFLFGDSEPLNGRRYVAYRGDVHLITDAYFHHLLADAPAFVDPAPIGSDAQPVGFSLPRGETIRLEQGRWRIEPPEPGVDAEAGERLANAWRRARAVSVRGFDPALNWNQAVQLELERQPEPLRFLVSELEYELVLGRQEWKVQYHFPKKAGKRLVTLND